jgi:large subunit ribosomal protein L10
MPTAEKAEVIEEAKGWYDKSVGVVFTDYRGLSVKEMQSLRRDVRKKGGELHVLKNTLFRIAAGDDINNFPAEFHNGTTAFAFVYENETDVSKALLDYAKSSKKLLIKGGYFGGKAFTSKEVEMLSELPPRDVLLAMVIGAIAAPISGLVGTIEALYADPIRVIGAVADKVAEANPLPKAAEPAPAPVAEAAPEPEVAAEPVAAAEPEAAAEEAATEEPAAEAPATEEATEAPAEEASPTEEPTA